MEACAYKLPQLNYGKNKLYRCNTVLVEATLISKNNSLKISTESLCKINKKYLIVVKSVYFMPVCLFFYLLFSKMTLRFVL